MNLAFKGQVLLKSVICIKLTELEIIKFQYTWISNQLEGRDAERPPLLILILTLTIIQTFPSIFHHLFKIICSQFIFFASHT